MYSNYGITFDLLGSWGFSNNFARNIANLGVDNSWSSHTNNRKNIFWILDEGPTDNITDSIGAAEIKFSINYNKTKTKCSLSLH